MLTRKKLGVLNILGDKYELARANLQEVTGSLGEVLSVPGFGCIDIDENLQNADYRQTLLHETLHALSVILGLSLSEEQVLCLAYGLERTISENPGRFAMSHYPNDYMIIKLWKQGNSLREIGKRLRLDKMTVMRALNRQGFDTSQPYFETVIRENDTSQPPLDTSQNVSKTVNKGRGNVGGKVVFIALALIFIGYLIYIIYTYVKNKNVRQIELKNEESPQPDKNLFDPTRDIDSGEFLG